MDPGWGLHLGAQLSPFQLGRPTPLFIGAAMGARFGYAPRACGAQSVPAPPARRAYGPGGFFLPLPVQFHNFLGDRVRAPPVQTKLHFVSLSSALHLYLSLSFFPARLSLVLCCGAEGLERSALLYRGCVAVAVALACAPAGAQCSSCVCFVVFCIVSRYKAGVLSGVRRLSISTAMGGLLGTGQ